MITKRPPEIVIAFETGIDSYEDGFDIEECPFEDPALKAAWLQGYEEAQSLSELDIL
jgi:ribosome modulation factor